VRRRSEKCVAEGFNYPHWLGLYLSFHLNWVLGSFVHGRLQNLQTSEDTLAHVITPLMGFRIHLILLAAARVSTDSFHLQCESIH